MTEPLKPICELPLELNLDGSMMWPSIEFTRDGAALYVRQPVSPPSLWDLTQWYAPEAALAVLALAFLWVALALRKVWRTPRETGKVYCRRCNYKLTPPLVERDASQRVRGGPGARCPECGSELGRVTPVVGRGAMARLGWAVGVGVPAMLLATGVLWWRLEPAAVGMGRPPWPIAGAGPALNALGLRSLAVQKRVPEGDRENMHRISRYAMPTGAPLGRPWLVPTHGFHNGRLSTDGSRYLTVVSEKHGRNPALMSIDTRTGSQHKVAVTEFGTPDIVGFSADGATAYVQLQTSRQTSMAGGGAWEGTASLHAYDVGTLTSQKIGEVTQPLMREGAGSWATPHQRFLVDDSASPPRWTLVTHEWDAKRVPTVARITHFDGMERKTYEVSGAATGGAGWYDPKLLDGGKTVEVNFYNAKDAVRVDLAGGKQTVAPTTIANFRGGSADGRWSIVTGNGQLQVVETVSGRVIGTLSAPALAGVGGGVVSNDGRRVAVVLWLPARNGAYSATVQVWDVPGAAAVPEKAP